MRHNPRLTLVGDFLYCVLKAHEESQVICDTARNIFRAG